MMFRNISCKIKAVLILSTGIGIAQATGMAVMLSNIVLVNVTNTPITVELPNISNSATTKLSANSSCQLKDGLMFVPNIIPNDKEFYVLFKVNNQYNPIMITGVDQLDLASHSKFSKSFTKQSNLFNLFASCSDEKNAWVSPIHTKVADGDANMPPVLEPRGCSSNYQYLYVYGNIAKKIILKRPITACKINTTLLTK